MTELLHHDNLIGHVAIKSNLPKAAVVRVLEALGDVTGTALASDLTVRLPGIGDLKSKQVPARSGVGNFGPYSKPAERRVTLRPNQALRTAINSES